MVDLMAGEPLATGMKLRGSQRKEPLDRSTASLQTQPGTMDGQTLSTLLSTRPTEGERLRLLGTGSRYAPR